MADVIPVPGRRGQGRREPSPDPWPSQVPPGTVRVVVEGRAVGGDHPGERCTTVVEVTSRGVVIWPYGGDRFAVALDRDAAARLARAIQQDTARGVA